MIDGSRVDGSHVSPEGPGDLSLFGPRRRVAEFRLALLTAADQLAFEVAARTRSRHQAISVGTTVAPKYRPAGPAVNGCPKDIHQNGKLQCGFNELVDDITDELNAMADTETQLTRIFDEESLYKEEHRKSMQELEEERDAVIEQCKHHSTTPRADGRADEPTTCDTCGAEVKPHV